MNPRRRAWLSRWATVTAAWSAGAGALTPLTARASADPAAGNDDPVRRGRRLRFPRDHGAHPGARTEWWYATGWIGTPAAPTLGFQLTFFRSRTGLAAALPGRFAPRQLLFAHAAVTDLAGRGRHLHAERIVRWNGDPTAQPDRARLDDADIVLGGQPAWRLWREDGPAGGPIGATAPAPADPAAALTGPAEAGAAPAHWRAQLPASDFTLDLLLQRSQPVLLQGDDGFSRKGPQETQASHYYSEPQLQVGGRIVLRGPDRAEQVLAADQGRAWLDQEWSEELLHPQAVGWDWIGMNLFDGGALTAFVLRRADGSTLWAGGSVRPPGGRVQAFEAAAVRFVPGRRWQSPATSASYPLEWTVHTPAGRFEVRALLDAQELDSRASTGAIYWEGLSELLDASGRRVGLGYLEMTGYAQPLRL
jgi:predicted secreted hydrolase